MIPSKNTKHYLTYNSKKSFKVAKFELGALLGYYAEYSANFFQTFRDNLSVPISRVKNPIGILGYRARSRLLRISRAEL